MKKVKPVKISGEYLIEIFKNKKFLSNLKRIRDCRGYEASFIVEQLILEPKFGISNVVYGGCDNVRVFTSHVDNISDTMLFKKERYDFYYLITVHSHPDGDPTPSCEDLGSLLRCGEHMCEYGIVTLPIMAIMPQYEDNKTNLLLIQEEQFLADDEELEERYGNLEKCLSGENIEEVSGVLNENGYKTRVIRMDGGMRYDRKSLETLSDFEFTPRIFSEIKFLKSVGKDGQISFHGD